MTNPAIAELFPAEAAPDADPVAATFAGELVCLAQRHVVPARHFGPASEGDLKHRAPGEMPHICRPCAEQLIPLSDDPQRPALWAAGIGRHHQGVDILGIVEGRRALDGQLEQRQNLGPDNLGVGRIEAGDPEFLRN